MTKNLLYVLVGAVVVLGGVYIVGVLNVPQSNELGASLINGLNPIFTQGLRIGATASQQTSITAHGCSAVTTWNPASVASSSPTGVQVTLAGATINTSKPQQLSVGIATSTQGLEISVYPTSTNAVWVVLSNPDYDGAAVNLATTSIQACYTAH